MKKRIFTVTAVLFSALIYFSSVSAFRTVTKPGSEPPAPVTESTVRDTFTNCILNASFNEINSPKWQLGNELHVARNLQRYNTLNFNAVHSYDESGSDVYGKADVPVLLESQITNYKNFLDSIKNQGGLYGFFERSFISKYCYGQRLIYEVAQDTGNYTLNYGFVYQNREKGGYTTDQGRTVIHAIPNEFPDNPEPGYIARNIYENLQHSDLFDFRQNDKGTWYIKPVMKIPGNTPPLTQVVRIEVIAFNGQSVRVIDIKAENFTQTGYNEKYIGLNPDLTISGKDEPGALNYGRGSGENWQTWDANCKVDFRVWWYGECEVWFDRMIVDDGTANDLFNPDKVQEIDDRINQEVTNFANHGSLVTFFMDEICISQYPCIKYVVEKMRENTNKPKFSLAVTNYLHVHGLKNDGLDFRIYLDSLKPDFLQDDHHGFSESSPKIPDVFLEPDSRIPQEWYANAYDYNINLQNSVIGGKNDAATPNSAGTLVYEIKKIRDCITQYSPSVKFIAQPQIHGLLLTKDISNDFNYGLREPTNEEIQMQAMVSLAHGADGLCWFAFNSYSLDKDSDEVYDEYLFGMLNADDRVNNRNTNCYGQNKWQYVSQMNGKIKNWIPALENTNWIEGYTVHQNTAGHEYIEDIKSIYRNSTNPYSFNESNLDPVKYWEEGFYTPKDPDDRSRYFLMVNRRCVPEVTEGTGDIRQLKIKFNTSHLTGFNNWILKDENTGQTITFDKNNQGADGYLNIGNSQGSPGWFNPGEGKLFKLAPVMQEGGTFVCDEYIQNTSFVCNAPVYTGGYNLSLISDNSSPMTASFKSGSKIDCENSGEVEIKGTQNNKIVLQGYGNEKGTGITCTGVTELTVTDANITGLSTGWAISAYECSYIDIMNCSFTLNVNGMKAINIISSSNPVTYSNIINNTISVKNCITPIYILSSAGSGNDLYFAGNYINSSEQSQIGAFLSNFNSVYIFDNSIGGFETGIKLLNCTLDLTNNAITGLGSDFTGIFCCAESTINIGLIGNYYYGGNNIIHNTSGNGCTNIKLDNSVFNMDYGNNDLQVDLNTGGYNMYGYGNFVTDDAPVRYIEAKGNCFNGEGNNAIHYITDPSNYIFSLHELPHNCNIQQDMIAEFTVQFTPEITDTVYKTTNPNYQNPPASKILYRNFYKNILLKNYDSAITKGMNLLTNYSDSVNSTDIVSKLYFAVSKLDTGGQRTITLKTFYEQVILNNSQNPLLVVSANYFIQKCKVRLHQYTSALEGFQDIMVQNPYSYEGVVASWDYAATLLLANSGGGFPGDEEDVQKNKEIESNREYLVDTLRINRLLKTDNYDKKVFTKEDRKQLHKSVGDILKEGRNRQTEKVKTLEEKLTKTEFNNNSKNNKNNNEKIKMQRELEDSKLINSVVKIKKPKDNTEYRSIINSDLEKLHPKKNSALTGRGNSIPSTYELYQNYPNPFNPVTKIAFDLPRDAKVKLVIYDILGREVRTLINNEFRTAGKYISEFNGSQLASGVYFARILVNEGKDFIGVKKMVLVK
jgi:hypothetical protein